MAKEKKDNTGSVVSSRALLLSIFFIVFLLIQAKALHAAAISSTSTGGLWGESSTWAGGVVPGINDSVTIASGATVTVNGDFSAGTILFEQGASGSSLIIGDHSLTVAQNIAVLSPSGAAQTNQIIVGSGTLTSGDIDIASTGSGKSQIILNTGVINVSGTISFFGFERAVLEVAGSGTINVAGNISQGGTLTTAAGSTINFIGTNEQSTPGKSLSHDYSYQTVKVNNPAGLQITGKLPATFEVSTLIIGDEVNNSLFLDAGRQMNSTGTVNIVSGTLRLGLDTNPTIFPAFTTINLAPDTTVEYAASVPQVITAIGPGYQNLVTSNSGTYTGVKTLAGSVTVNGNMTIGSGTILDADAASSYAMTIKGNWTNNGTFLARNGVVSFNGSGSQTISGSTIWSGLRITGSAARTVLFESAKTQTISTGGSLTLAGQVGKLLSLSPTTPGQSWLLNVDSGVTPAISYVSPSYSDARGGSMILADTSNHNGGNNQNWKFGTTTVLSSAPGSSVYGSEVIFTATVTTGATGTVTFKDGESTLGTASLSGSIPNTASLSTSLLSAGTHTITASFNGDVVYEPSVSNPVVRIVEKAIPTITWNSPTDITYGTALSEIQLNANAAIAGVYTYSPASGTLLSAGAGQILHLDFTPTDAANYTASSKEVTINVLKAGGSIVIQSSAPEIAQYGSSFIPEATSDTGISVNINASGACSGSGNGSAIVVMTSGSGTCTITYGAENFNQALTETTQARPKLTVSMLSDGAVTKNETLNINGEAGPAATVAVTVNNESVTVNPDGSFSTAITLASGENIIEIVAVHGEATTTITRTIILDTTSPALIVTFPADNIATNIAVITVTGTFEETSTITLAVNGQIQEVTMAGNGFSATVDLATGPNIIEVTATDGSGKTSSLSRTVTYSTQKPGLAITSPPQDITTNLTSIPIDGLVSDVIGLGGLTIMVSDGISSYPVSTIGEDGGFTQTISLNEEKIHAITVTATDGAGNATTVQRNIIYSKWADIDGNGTTEIADALKAYAYYMGMTSNLTEVEKIRCDVAPLGPDGKPAPDGAVELGDVVLILRKAVGLVDW